MAFVKRLAVGGEGLDLRLGLLRRGNALDVFGGQAGEEAFAELALDVVGVGVVAETNDDGVIVHGLAGTFDEANPRRGIGFAAGDFPGGFGAGVGEDWFDAFGIGVMRDLEIDDDGIFDDWGRVIDEDGGGEFGVGNDDGGVRERLHARGAPAELADEAFLATFHKDVIADLNWIIEAEIESREKIGERVLQGERDGNAADAERGPDGFELDIEIFENKKSGDDSEDDFRKELDRFAGDGGAFGFGYPAIQQELKNLREEIEDEDEDDDVEAAIDASEDFARDIEEAEGHLEEKDEKDRREALGDDVCHFAVVGAFAAAPATEKMDYYEADDGQAEDEEGDFGAVDEPGVELGEIMGEDADGGGRLEEKGHWPLLDEECEAKAVGTTDEGKT